MKLISITLLTNLFFFSAFAGEVGYRASLDEGCDYRTAYEDQYEVKQPGNEGGGSGYRVTDYEPYLGNDTGGIGYRATYKEHYRFKQPGNEGGGSGYRVTDYEPYLGNDTGGIGYRATEDESWANGSYQEDCF